MNYGRRRLTSCAQLLFTVSVERRYKHPLLQKTIRKSKKYRAHDENNAFNVGDQVRIIECPPRSKTKRWEVIAS